MALTITSPFDYPFPHLGDMLLERLKVVGGASAAADTGTVVPKYVNPIGALGGNFQTAFSAPTLTLTANAAQASTTTYVDIFGYPL